MQPGNPVLDYGFVNVKHLEVEVRSMTKQVAGIFQLYHLIRACPSVEKLMIKVYILVILLVGC